MMKNKALLSLLMILLPFQACTDKLVFSTIDGKALTAGMNGEGYGGKPTPYDFTDKNAACSEIGANGKPLPNSQIFMFSSGLAQLVRENCTDISPRPLSTQEYSIDQNGNIIYHNQIFSPNVSQTPFDVVAASCPAGKTLIPNAVRTSLMREPLDLQAWMWEHPGLGVSLVGSMASLPLYQVQRNDPNALESWHRMAQSVIFEAGESYVFSFYVKPDATEKVRFTSYYPNVEDFEMEFDLITGASTTYSTVGVSSVVTKAQSFAGGLYINIYFQSQNTVHANIGLASSGQFIGSSISTTALQIEKISNFCTP